MDSLFNITNITKESKFNKLLQSFKVDMMQWK